jgi:hypothetical protein
VSRKLHPTQSAQAGQSVVSAWPNGAGLFQEGREHEPQNEGSQVEAAERQEDDLRIPTLPATISDQSPAMIW